MTFNGGKKNIQKFVYDNSDAHMLIKVNGMEAVSDDGFVFWIFNQKFLLFWRFTLSISFDLR